MNSKEYKFADGRTAVFEYDENGEGRITLECMDAIMDRIAKQWIPCSETERLPENEVLCCDVHQTLMIGYVFASEKNNTGYSAESECEYMYDCVAWMPLPKPYTEVNNGN